MSKSSRNRSRARQTVARMRELEARRRRWRWLAVTGAVAVAAAAGIGIALAVGGGGLAGTGGGAGRNAAGLHLASLSTLGKLAAAPAPGPAGPEGVPIPAAPVLAGPGPAGPGLAGPGTIATGRTVDGIGCDTSEQTLFHIHAHLTIFVNGSPRQVPAGIGIPAARAQSTPQGPFIVSGNCFYWLHTHAADGIIHIESPVHRTYTLGEFFDEWGQQLGPGQVGPARGRVTAIYNGRVYRGSPRDIPLTAHAQIQLEIGTPLVAPESITWPGGL